MNKKKIIIIVVSIILCISLIITGVIIAFNKGESKEERRQKELLKNATIIVDLKEDLAINILDSVKVSDFITNINGTIVDDFIIDTSKLGSKEVSFEYINEENIKIPYSYKINVVDQTPPVIWVGNSYSITTDYKGSLLEDIVCADNYDDNPKCEIIGTYNTKKVGVYNLTFKATDASGNITSKDFSLNVKKPETNKPSNNTKPTYTYFTDVIENYKTNNTKIGIDVSSWQGDIDFQAVKNAGVEFVFIRVGSTTGIEGEFYVDKQFKNNIKGFNEVGIPVGIYFYSYANSEKKAIEEAEWVLNEIKGYQVDLPIVYDWESWSFFNAFHQSFYSTTKNAKAFLDTISAAGYKGLLYSSKNYLEKVWFDTGYDVWLAHYTTQTNYQGNYSFWQLCSNGSVPGISGRVDIDIMYT